MNTAYEILVLVLSATLAIFLILSVIAVSLVLKLLGSLRAVVAKGEHIVDSAEELTDTLRRNAGAVGLLKVLMRFVATMNNKREK